MERRHRSVGEVAYERIVEHVHVEVQNVELIGHPSDLVEHKDVMGSGVLDARIKPQRDFAAGLQASRGARIPASEQSDVVALPH